jgi:hypothetical protein
MRDQNRDGDLMHKQFYVYIHKKPDGTPFYVGKGTGNRAYQFSKRTQWHKNIVAKYRKENIIVQIINCINESQAFDLEKIYIKQFKMDGIQLVNLTDGGEGSSGYKPTEETKKKLKKTPEQRAVLSELAKGRTQSEETKAKRIASMIGATRSEESKEKQRQASTGVVFTEERKAKIAASRIGKSSWNKGKQFSEESRKKMSEAKKGKPQNPEHKAKRLAACAESRAKKTCFTKK